jgi:hypothetical protein
LRREFDVAADRLEPSAIDPPIPIPIPGVTYRMRQEGAEALASAADLPAEELATAKYQAMAFELNVVSVGDS